MRKTCSPSVSSASSRIPSRWLGFCVVFLAFALPLRADDEGRLQSIDTKAYTLTVTRGFVVNSYHYPASLEVKVDGQRAAVTDLTPGMMLKVKTSGKGVAARILATAPTSFDQKQFPGPMIVKVSGRSLTIAGIIEGADAIKVQATGIWWEHVSGMNHGMPAQVTLNDLAWVPEWNGRTSTQLTFEPALDGFATATVTVKKLSGRSRMKTELPTPENKGTLSVLFTDGEIGSGPAEVQIDW